MNKPTKSERLVHDLHHLGHEIHQLASATHHLQPGSQDYVQAYREWQELNDTYTSKERALRAVEGPRPVTARAAALGLIAANNAWDRAAAALQNEGYLPLRAWVATLLGPGRYTTEVWVFSVMDSAFRRALVERGGVVVDQRPSLGAQGLANPLHYYTISLPEIDDLFEVARIMVLVYYAELQEGGERP